MQESILQNAVRSWVSEQHIRNVLQGEWVPLYDADNNLLPGIRGRIGASATKIDTTEIGIDLIEMSPGSAFPLHEHEGDHILYVLSGAGSVRIKDQDHPIKAGDSIWVPAETAHAVAGPGFEETEPLVLLAFGHPHKHVTAHDRMRHPHQ